MKNGNGNGNGNGHSVNLDRIDLRILEILQDNAQTRFSDMADELDVSSGTIHVRTKKMKEHGIIEGSTVKINLEKLGYDLQATAGIEVNADSNMCVVISKLKEVPEIVSCASTVGRFSMIISIVCKDTKHLKRILHDEISNISGVSRIETFLCLEHHFDKSLQLLTNKQEAMKKSLEHQQN